LKTFDENKNKITESLRKGFNDMSTLGKCPADGGELIVRWSKAGKRFAGCANYPKCTRTYSLQQKGKIIPTDKICEGCKTPIIKLSFGRNSLEMDLDPACPLRAKPAVEPVEQAQFKSKVVIAENAHVPGAADKVVIEAPPAVKEQTKAPKKAVQPKKVATNKATKPKAKKKAKKADNLG
jgi:ssDNA-binding Zn-finger/Zn-ribbon topoisomerase 1